LGEVAEPERPAVPLLEARGLVKHYGSVQALDGASFSAHPGEVVALIGDNGAGKSTLVKTLSGAIRPDRGQILVGGTPVSLSSPLDARAHGIETVYQDLALAPDLDAAANLHLGREIYRLVAAAACAEQARDAPPGRGRVRGPRGRVA
jgi:simple sugar transport system ATP-binding protein